jgi:hypothetical protein
MGLGNGQTPLYSIWSIEKADGKPVPYGLDFGSESVPPPGSSVLFSVARVHLSNGRIIFVGFSYLKENEKYELEDYSTPHRVSFRSSP